MPKGEEAQPEPKRAQDGLAGADRPPLPVTTCRPRMAMPSVLPLTAQG